VRGSFGDMLDTSRFADSIRHGFSIRLVVRASLVRPYCGIVRFLVGYCGNLEGGYTTLTGARPLPERLPRSAAPPCARRAWPSGAPLAGSACYGVGGPADGLERRGRLTQKMGSSRPLVRWWEARKRS
jgi:hypothetical protein